MHRLVMVGLNHTTTPLAMREKLVFSGDQKLSALQAFRERFPASEIVLLSTCNRVELYAGRAVHGHPRLEELIEFVAAFHHVPAAQITSHFYKKASRDVVSHLFTVTAALDSLVLGESQIIGQVREAYELAQQACAVGPALNPLFQRAIAVGKQVMSETPLGEGRLSVASVAVEYARQIFDEFAGKTVLTIGAGKMATLAMRHFQKLRPGRLLICNRDPAKAAALAEQFGGVPVTYDDLNEHLVAADIVISSTGAPHAIITRQRFEQIVRLRRYRPVFLIDIALPRDVEESVGEIENVYLYNIDDLQQVVAATVAQRATAVAAARQIVEKQVEEYLAWHRVREMGPLIDRLYRRYQDIARDEIARTLNKLGGAIGDEEKQHLEELARRMVNKFLHDPVRTLRQTDGHGPTPRAVEKLFGLAEGDSPGENQPPTDASEDR